jgi:hypothetical protein
LSIVAMAAALTARSHAKAMLAAIGKVLALPWILYGIVFTVTSLWMALGSPIPRDWSPSWKYGVGWWFALGILVDVGLGWRAWRRLQNHFRLLALASFSPKPLRSGALWRGRPSAAGDFVSTYRGRPWRKTLKPAIIFVAAVLVCAGALFIGPSSKKPPAPPVIALGRTNTALRVLPREGGVLFLLPDGSLWRWGAIPNWPYPRAAIPERLGWDSDWTDVSLSYRNFVGLRSHGTVWQWDWHAFEQGPWQVDTGRDWMKVSAGNGHSVVLKRDGTLWAWGDNLFGQLGISPGPTNAPFTRTNLTQIGTNNDWKSVDTWGLCDIGLRGNGTLWIWGYIGFSSRPGSFSHTNSNFPTQFCQETNWAELSSLGARNQAGELWRLPYFAALPSATTSVSTISYLLASNLTSAAPAIGVFRDTQNSLALYEIRSNGTLWAKPLVGQPWAGLSTAGPWEQVGKRTDWIAVWGHYGPVVALTADGTLWTWGPDFSEEPSMTFQARVQALKGSLAGKMGAGFASPPSPEFPFQKEPRPLMRMAPTKRE